jgi:hypothetical protein
MVMSAFRSTKEINPEHCFELIQCVAAVLMLTKTLRIARITKNVESLDLPVIDREGIMRLEPASKFSLPY